MELGELGKTPISALRPAGEDIRSGAEFEALTEEIEKIPSPALGTATDWKRVAELATQILGEKSKDLLVWAYLGVALLKIRGLPGLLAGVQVLRDLIENFWEEMFPPEERVRARRNALEWWREKVQLVLEEVRMETLPRDQVGRFLGNLQAVDALLKKKLPDAPSLSALTGSLRSLIEIQGERAGEIQAPAKVPLRTGTASEERPAPRPASTAVQSRESGEEMEKMLRQGFDLLARVAADLARKNRLNPLRFRLNRAIAWIPVVSLPSHSDGRTLIPPPDLQIAASLRSLYQAGNWKDLMEAAESRVPQFLFWLDLNRYVVESLEHLDQKPVGEELKGETLSYLRRLPGIERLSFSDGTPFADAATRSWLERVSFNVEEPRPFSEPPAIALDLAEGIAGETEEAVALARKGKWFEALTRLKEKMEGSPCGREGFIREIWFCRFLIATQHDPLAQAYFHRLIAHMDRHRLEDWEPSLVVEGLTTILHGLDRSSQKDEALRQTALRKFALLDPARAAEFCHRPSPNPPWMNEGIG